MRFLTILFLACALALPARAADLALILAIDVSGSISGEEYELQKHGTADALLNEVFIMSLENREVMITVVEWSQTQKVQIPWVMLRDRESVVALANRVRGLQRTDSAWTGIGSALTFCLQLLEQVDARLKVIDVSGDGINNHGPGTQEARAIAEARSVTINGLPILAEDPTLDRYYRENVITSDGFVVPARDHKDIGKAMEMKLALEVAANW